jgi:hypothetical protein
LVLTYVSTRSRPQEILARAAFSGKIEGGSKEAADPSIRGIRITPTSMGRCGLSTASSTVGGVELAHPADPDGPPDEVARCRCVLLFVEAGES